MRDEVHLISGIMAAAATCTTFCDLSKAAVQSEGSSCGIFAGQNGFLLPVTPYRIHFVSLSPSYAFCTVDFSVMTRVTKTVGTVSQMRRGVRAAHFMGCDHLFCALR